MNSFSVEKFRSVIQKGSKPRLRPRPCLVVSKDFREILEGQFNLKIDRPPKKISKRGRADYQRQEDHKYADEPSFSLSEVGSQKSIDESAFKQQEETMDLKLNEFMRILNSKESFEDPTLRASMLIQEMKPVVKPLPVVSKAQPVLEDYSPRTGFADMNFMDMLKESEEKPTLATKAEIRERLRHVKFDSKVFDIYEPEFSSEDESANPSEKTKEKIRENEKSKTKGFDKNERKTRLPTVPVEYSGVGINKIPYIRNIVPNNFAKKPNQSSIEKLPPNSASQSNLDEKRSSGKLKEDVFAIYSTNLPEKGKASIKSLNKQLMDFRKKHMNYEPSQEKVASRSKMVNRETSRNSRLTPNKISIKEYSLISNEVRNIKTPVVAKSTSIQQMGSNSKKSSFCAKKNDEKSTSLSKRQVLTVNFKKELGNYKFIYKPGEDSIYNAPSMMQTLVKGEPKRSSQASNK
jgi:hypothetical protein